MASRHSLDKSVKEGLIKGCYLHRRYDWPEKLPRTEAAWEDPATLENLAIWECD